MYPAYRESYLLPTYGKSANGLARSESSNLRNVHIWRNIQVKNTTTETNRSTVAFRSCDDAIKVYLRVRPQDASDSSEPCLRVADPTTLTLACRPEPRSFTFDHVANVQTTQVGRKTKGKPFRREPTIRVGGSLCSSREENHRELRRRLQRNDLRLVRQKERVGVVQLHNVLISLGSGQTGSGKTFTMLGPPDESDAFTHRLRGIIPRTFDYLFSLVSREQQKVILGEEAAGKV